jgi:hypothetical protein
MATGAGISTGVGGSVAAFGGFPLFALGLVAITAKRTTTHGAAFQVTNAPRFTSFNKYPGPCPPKKEKYIEPTFAEIQLQYHAQLADRSKNAQNATPLEAK